MASIISSLITTFKQELRSSKPEIAYYISSKDKLRKDSTSTPVVEQQPTPSQKTPSAPIRPPNFDEVCNFDGTPKSINAEGEEGDLLAYTLHLVDDPEPADVDGVNSELESELEELIPPLPFELTDSDNDSEMAEERTITPIQFNGSANDDAEQLPEATTGTWDALKEGFL